MIGKLQDHPGITCGVWQSRPQSKGYVRAPSNNIKNNPIIQPNYLKEKIDQDLLIQGVKMCRTLLKTSNIEKMLARHNSRRNIEEPINISEKISDAAKELIPNDIKKNNFMKCMLKKDPPTPPPKCED